MSQNFISDKSVLDQAIEDIDFFGDYPQVNYVYDVFKACT